MTNIRFQDVDHMDGLPPIYQAYRSTVLGETLMEVLNEAENAGVIKKSHYISLMKEFDRSFVQNLTDLPEETCSIKGNTTNYQYINDLHRVIMEPAVIRFPDAVYTAKCLEILTLEGDSPEDPKKRGRKKGN